MSRAIHTTTSENLVPHTSITLPAIRVVSSNLDELLQSAIALEKQKINIVRVDGRIIGTGEADFTKGNTFYTLNYKGKIFQLIDVPGIEGNESKYSHMVLAAVAKAHLVFYVNGTNKKPEKATAEKIRSYLRYGTKVCPIVNVKDHADAYEFEEDRETLESHSGAATALKQTIVVLKSVLDEKVLLPGHCVQGLLAFSSLARNSKSEETTIHPSRDRDLVVQQRNYLKHFASAKAMFEFSQMQAVEKVLHSKIKTFRKDIIESNKEKVRELLVENISILQEVLKSHEAFMTKVKPEFEKCHESINESIQTFERLITAGRENLWNKFFNELTTRSDKSVAEHFGDNDRITAEIKKDFKTLQDGMGVSLHDLLEEHIEVLQKSMSQSIKRLIQDVQRVKFQQRINFDQDGQKAVYRSVKLDMELDLKEWGSIAFNVGSYALTGAGIGSSFPGIGTAIGAAIGAVVGALVSVMHLFTSKEKRIRKAQSQVQVKIDEVRDQVISGLSEEMKNLMKPVRKEFKETTLRQVEEIHSNLAHPLVIIRKQIKLMTRINIQLEEMPYGTIQAIQH